MKFVLVLVALSISTSVNGKIKDNQKEPDEKLAKYIPFLARNESFPKDDKEIDAFCSQDVEDVKKSLSKLTHKPLYNKKIKNFVESFDKFYNEELCKDGEKKKFFKEAAAQINKAKDKFHKIATEAIAASEYWTEHSHKGNMKNLLKKTCCVQKKLLDGLIETAVEDADKSENSSGTKLAEMIKDHTEKHSNLCKRGCGDKCDKFDWPDTKEAKAQCNSLLTTQALYATKVDIF